MQLLLPNLCSESARWRAERPWGPVPTPPPGTSWVGLMHKALRMARAAAACGEVPVGALVVDGCGRILAEAHNETEATRDPTAHAEVLALRRAARLVGNNRLEGCVLVVTLEPCMMCTGAIRESRISGVVYGASDSRAGAVVSCIEGLDYARTGGEAWHLGGVESAACASLLRKFFQPKR